jgi:uncharacterized protein
VSRQRITLLFGIGAEAIAFRKASGGENIAILADVNDRTAVPFTGETQEQAAEWAQKIGSNGLNVTGLSFDDPLGRVVRVRAASIKRPIVIGGSGGR